MHHIFFICLFTFFVKRRISMTCIICCSTLLTSSFSNTILEIDNEGNGEGIRGRTISSLVCGSLNRLELNRTSGDHSPSFPLNNTNFVTLKLGWNGGNSKGIGVLFCSYINLPNKLNDSYAPFPSLYFLVHPSCSINEK